MSARTDIDDFESTYKIYRDYIEHENGLINNRITWMLTIHGFLYATYGFTVQKLLEVNEKISALHVRPIEEYCRYIVATPLAASVTQLIAFLGCICFVGLVISAVALRSIAAAYEAATGLHLLFDDFIKTSKYDVPLERLIEYKGAESYGHLTTYVVKYVDATQTQRQKRFPFLSGGGYFKGEERGYTAAWGIPGVLIVGWLISAGFLIFETSVEHRLFRGAECPQIDLQRPKPVAHTSTQKVEIGFTAVY